MVPASFAEPHLLPIDLYFLLMLLVGLALLVRGLIAIRRSPFPRTEGYGATLLGGILLALAGAIFFARLWTLAAVS
jgi:hypothetical protein